MGNSLHHPLHSHDLHAMKREKIANTALCAVCHGPFRSKKLYGCEWCGNYFMHRLCAQMPKQITHSWHKGHSLSLRDGRNGQFLCSMCGVSGTGINYTCNVQGCGVRFHPLCAFLPLIKSHHHTHNHGYLHPDKKDSFTCWLCGDGGSEYLHYSCNECEYRVHASCLTDESSRKQLAVYRPSKSRAMGIFFKIAMKKLVSHSIGLGLVGEVASGVDDFSDAVTAIQILLASANLVASDGKYLQMKWDDKLPGFSTSRSQKKEKILKELIMVFCNHMKHM